MGPYIWKCYIILYALSILSISVLSLQAIAKCQATA